MIVTSHNNSVLNTSTMDNVAVTTGAPPTPTPTPLPTPWVTQDIGSVGVTGSASFANNTFTVKGSGVDIWGNADSFRYVYQPLSGDGEIVARVASLQNTHTWAKAGVMIRESLNPDARHVFVALSAGNGIAFQRRVTTAGVSAHTFGGPGTAPYWVKPCAPAATLRVTDQPTA